MLHGRAAIETWPRPERCYCALGLTGAGGTTASLADAMTALAAASIEALAATFMKSITAHPSGRGPRNHGLPLRVPVELYLAARVNAVPPAPPRQGSRVEVMLWSLQLRFWAWRNDAFGGPKPHVRMFVKYFAPRPNLRLQHSVGLREGLIGVVNAFASTDMEHAFGARSQVAERIRAALGNQPSLAGQLLRINRKG